MTKKSQAAMEFLMTYSWVLLVVVIVISALAFFGVFQYFPNNYTPIHTCQNLEKSVNDSIALYPAITQTKTEIEQGWAMFVTDMNGDEITVRGHDKNGVTCILPATACIMNTYCIKIDMLIPVNYTQYNEWIKN